MAHQLQHQQDHHHYQQQQQQHSPYFSESSSSESTETRFENGSSRNCDQAPSIHVCKSRSMDQDCSEQSFQLGMDPIERDWGDSLSISKPGSDRGGIGRSSLTNYNNSLPSVLAQERNAVYKPRCLNYDYDHDQHCKLPDCSVPYDTRPMANSSFGRRSSHHHDGRKQHNLVCEKRPPIDRRCLDHCEQAESSRPNMRRVSQSDGSLASIGSTSRSAPMRRTRIAREPSLYHVDSSKHSNNSSRTFSYRRDSRDSGGGGQDSEKEKYRQYMPQEAIDIVLSQDREEKRQANTTRGGRVVPPKQNQTMVDIAPGVKVPLRGSQETYKAVAKDFYSNLSCFGCSIELCCVADVRYVICPECKVISPMEESHFEGLEVKRHGLGLGFTYENLFEIQVEIMKGRSNGNP